MTPDFIKKPLLLEIYDCLGLELPWVCEKINTLENYFEKLILENYFEKQTLKNYFEKLTLKNYFEKLTLKNYFEKQKLKNYFEILSRHNDQL